MIIEDFVLYMLLTIITFILVLSILVFVHELGHFLVARKFGVRAEEFGLGFPPRIFGWQFWQEKRDKNIAEEENIKKRIEDMTLSDGREFIKETMADKVQAVNSAKSIKKWRFIFGGRELNKSDEKFGTVYSLNWLPLGGFVKIKGEDGQGQDERDSFASRPVWQRSIMLSAGVLMNVFLAMILISIGFIIGQPQVIEGLDDQARITDKKIQIVQVVKQSPADKANLKIGDTIVSIDGKIFLTYDDLQNYVNGNVGKKLEYKIKQGSEEFTKEIVPEMRQETSKGGIGIVITETGIVRYPWYLAISEGIKTTFYLIWAIILAFYELVKGLILGQGVSAELAGPVGIAALTGQVVRLGIIYLVQFAALLSINLAIINFLPFPALDGGRVLFLIIEKVKGSPVRREVENVIHNIGFTLLMVLVALVTFRDVINIESVRNIWEKIIG